MSKITKDLVTVAPRYNEDLGKKYKELGPAILMVVYQTSL